MTSTLRRATATLAVTALAVGPVALLTAAPASAAEREGRCDGAEFQLEVDKEGKRFEVDADIDDAAPGSRWRVVLKHEGKTYVNVERRADSDGEISLDRNRPNTKGADVFTMRVNKVGTSGGCTHTIRFRS